MSHCHICNRQVNPVIEMGDGMRMQSFCPTCRGALRASSIVAPESSIVLPVNRVLTVLEFAKMRLSEVRSKITDVRNLEAEASMLERMIAAAEDQDDQIESMPLLPIIGRA